MAPPNTTGNAARKNGVSINLFWIQAIAHNSMNTMTNAVIVAVQKCGIKYGSACPNPPTVVITPDATPRFQGDPRPDNDPSSDAASVKPMEIPAPTDAARPTKNVVQVSWVAKAVAKIGANVDTDPSISPANPGCTHVKTNWRAACVFSVSASAEAFSVSVISWADLAWLVSASAKSPNNLRVSASWVRAAACR